MTFGKKIQKLRNEAGISQEELSFQLQVSRQAISKWENDKGYPEIEKIIRMSNIFQVSLDFLLNDTGSRGELEQQTEAGFYVSYEMMSGYLLHEAIKYKKVAWAIALLLGGIAFVFLFNLIGVVLYLITIIASITMLVSVLLVGNRYPQIKQEYLFFDDTLKKELVSTYHNKKKKHHGFILGSILLFSISILVLPLLIELQSGVKEEFILAISMILCGVGVYVFVYFLSTLRSYQLLVKNEGIPERMELK